MSLPKNFDSQEAEPRLQEFWEKEKIFRFNSEADKTFSIDTPPPTLSGKMHMGHAFSYAQGDFIARYKRMRGHSVLYPFGTDDNGLPTEKLIEKQEKVRSTHMDRSEFRKLVLTKVNEQIKEFTADWVRLGISADFENAYSTINDHCRRISQKSFLDLYKKELIYKKKTPVSWCPKCQTAIAQAEFENVDLNSKFNDIAFRDEVGNELVIATTRPELLPACVAVAAHPEDERYKHLKGKMAVVPLMGYKVPIVFDESVEKDKGTGILMVCTFGDKEDIEKWYKFDLELRSIFTKDGKLNEVSGKYNGMTIKEAREAILQDLDAENYLKGQQEITHAVNVHERCGTELEFLNTDQWFIKVIDNKELLLEAGNNIKWYPEFMKVRYDHWVENLNWDWCISRQRHYGVAIPIWYDKEGNVVLPEESQLPIDPTEDKPANFDGEVTPETDVMDTWATSSLTPQIVLNWEDKIEPMDVRLQAHDIIRTWAFYTIVKAQYHQNTVPWNDIVISGHGLDPKGKKMSKSKGNVIDPNEKITKYSADALRFWAASTKLGEDLPFMEKDLATGQKTIVKLWNASKFAIMHLEKYNGNVPDFKLELIDRWLLTKFFKMVESATNSFEKYEYSRTKSEVENFFWNTFCDYYLEIVKDRLYNPDKRGEDQQLSAQFTLYTVLLGQLKLFAPIMPHITEEIYLHFFAEKEKHKSIHISDWPMPNPDFIFEESIKGGDLVVQILGEIRKYKSENQISLGAELEKIMITMPAELRKEVDLGVSDLKAASRAKEIEFLEGSELKIEF